VGKSKLQALSGFWGFLVPMLVVFFTLPIQKSYLPAMEFGLNQASGHLINYLTIFDFAFEMLLIRMAIDARKSGNQTFWNTMSALLIMLISVNLVLLLLAAFFGNTLISVFLGGLDHLSLKRDVLFLTLGYFFLTGINLFVYFKEAVEERYQKRNLIYVFNIALGNILAAVFLVWQEDLRYFLIGKMVPSFVSGFIFLIANAQSILSGINSKTIQTINRLVNYLKPGLLIRFNELFLSKSDLFLIQLLIGLEVLGGYANSYLISSSIFMLCKKVFEFSINRFAAKDQDIAAYFKKMFTASVELLTLIFGGFIALSNDLIKAWIPNRNEVELQFIVPHLLYFFLQGITTIVLLNYLLAQNRIREYSRLSIFRNTFMMLAVSILIWQLKIQGMYWAFALIALADVAMFGYFAGSSIKENLSKLIHPLFLSLALFPVSIFINSYSISDSLVQSVLIKGSLFTIWFLIVGHFIFRLRYIHISSFQQFIFNKHESDC